eukprot:TRINITY_DN624_c0_g1_i1.p1 TRINITY_DN624_c0_g1~~TRINITY_DN624_c0_g1_i1.p1  ORF type:complete len:173 (-),score=33.48 TRINITY_DN624_c0_g1_i1:51-569(-)
MLTRIFLGVVIIGCVVADCVGGIKPTKQSLTSCYWYNDNSCCTPETVTDLNTGQLGTIFGQMSQGCKDQFNLLFCAACSPDASSWANFDIGTNTTIDDVAIKICAKFADKFYSACKDESVQGSQTIGSVFPDAKSFFAATQFLQYSETEPCFNEASVLFPLAAIIAILTFAL